MKINYYKKFSWCWFWLLIVGAVALTVQSCTAGFSQRISLLEILPNWSKYILTLLLLSGIPVEYFARKSRNISMPIRVWRCITRILLLLVYIDRLLLGFVSRCIVVAELDANPEPLLDSMLYMAINSREIWLGGIIGTLELSMLGTVIGFFLAVLLVFMRVNTPDVRDKEPIQFIKLIGETFEKIYVTVIRGTPMMVQACVIYYGGFTIVRTAMAEATITQINQAWSFFTAGLITVSLNTAAYLAEALRGGIESLDKGQREAAESLGFTHWQAMRRVIFPQAVRNSMPAICNEFINNIKGTSVLNIIGVVELMFATGTVAGYYYKYLASYCVAAVIYLIMTFSLTTLLNSLATRFGAAKPKDAKR